MKDRTEWRAFILSEIDKWRSRTRDHQDAALAHRLAGNIPRAEEADAEAVAAVGRTSAFAQLLTELPDIQYEADIERCFEGLRRTKADSTAYMIAFARSRDLEMRTFWRAMLDDGELPSFIRWSQWLLLPIEERIALMRVYDDEMAASRVSPCACGAPCVMLEERGATGVIRCSACLGEWAWKHTDRGRPMLETPAMKRRLVEAASRVKLTNQQDASRNGTWVDTTGVIAQAIAKRDGLEVSTNGDRITVTQVKP